MKTSETIRPLSSTEVPRFAGPSTFARLPELRDVEHCDIAILGAPFDGGTSYRPGARFGPQAVRQASRHLRTQFHPNHGIEPFVEMQVADVGDVACNPFSIEKAIDQIELAANETLKNAGHLITIGGDHTIALPLLRAMNQRFGPVALVHFDAHLDTWDTYFDAPFTHGTPFRRAAEEGLFLDDCSLHVGIRGPLHGKNDLIADEELGFRVVSCLDIANHGAQYVIDRIHQRVGDRPMYLSIDIDVLDPAHAPGTGTPEVAGMTTREIHQIIQGCRNLNIIGADVVEIAPAYDHAELTALAGASIVYEIINLMALNAIDNQ